MNKLNNDFLLATEEKLKLEDLKGIDAVFPSLVQEMAKIGIVVKIDNPN